MFSFTIFSTIFLDNIYSILLIIINISWPVLSSPFIFCEFLFILVLIAFILNSLLLLLNSILKYSLYTSNFKLNNKSIFYFSNLLKLPSQLILQKLFS